MLNVQAIPAVWVYTATPAFNSMRFGGYGSFLTKEQQARLERIRQARMLFDGQHREYYLDERRSEFDFPPIRAEGRIVKPYRTVNAIKLVCKKTADMVFGLEAKVDVDDEIQATKLADLADRSALDQLWYNTCLECSYEAEGFLEGFVEDGAVYCRSIPADEIFPVGELGPDNQYRRYVRYRLQNVGTEQRAIWLLLETWYRVGSIENKLWQLGDDGKRQTQLTLDNWPQEEGETPLRDVLPTGIDRNTITWVYNELNRKRPASLVDQLIPLQDALNAKQTQIDRVLAKHSDPKLAVPESGVDPSTGGIRGDHDVFFFRSKEEVPAYIVWQAQLEAAQKSKSEALALLCLTAEISPALLGLKEGAAPDAARKLRLEATNTIAMAQRVGSNWKPGIRRALGVAQDLEQTIPGERYDRLPIAVKMRDGLPIDTLDQASELSTLKAAELLSTERGVGILIEDKAEADAEVARINDAKAAAIAAAAPSVLLGEPGQGATVAGGGDTLPGNTGGGGL